MWIYQPKKVIFTEVKGPGEYHMNSLIKQIEVNYYFVIWKQNRLFLNFSLQLKYIEFTHSPILNMGFINHI